MAFSTSTELFQSVFMPSEPEDENTSVFFQAVLRYLAERIELYDIEEAVLLYEWISAGNPMKGFMCRIDLVQDVADDFMTEGIPFLCIEEPYGNVGFLIRACDADKSNKIKQGVLDKRAKFCEVISSDELVNRTIKSSEADKNILYITNLSAEQIEILQQLCEENIDETEVGIDEMNDGTFMFSFSGKHAMKKTGKRLASLNQIFALMMLQSLGLNSDVNKRIARNELAVNKAIIKGFARPGIDLRKSPAWVVGRGRHYMRLNGSGFEYGVAVPKDNGQVTLEEQYSVDGSTPDYEMQLNSYLARIDDKTFTYDMRQAIRHLEGRESSLNFSKSRDDRIIESFERELVEKADIMVMEKIRSDPVMTMDERWDEKFEHYLGEMAELIDGARMDEVPDGYTRDEINELKQVGDDHGISLEAYLPAISGMRHIETTLSRARLPEIKDINKKIADINKDRHPQNRDFDGRTSRAPAARGGAAGGVSKEAIAKVSEPSRASDHSHSGSRDSRS